MKNVYNLLFGTKSHLNTFSNTDLKNEKKDNYDNNIDNDNYGFTLIGESFKEKLSFLYEKLIKDFEEIRSNVETNKINGFKFLSESKTHRISDEELINLINFPSNISFHEEFFITKRKLGKVKNFVIDLIVEYYNNKKPNNKSEKYIKETLGYLLEDNFLNEDIIYKKFIDEKILVHARANYENRIREQGFEIYIIPEYYKVIYPHDPDEHYSVDENGYRIISDEKLKGRKNVRLSDIDKWNEYFYLAFQKGITFTLSDIAKERLLRMDIKYLYEYLVNLYIKYDDFFNLRGEFGNIFHNITYFNSESIYSEWPFQRENTAFNFLFISRAMMGEKWLYDKLNEYNIYGCTPLHFAALYKYNTVLPKYYSIFGAENKSILLEINDIEKDLEYDDYNENTQVTYNLFIHFSSRKISVRPQTTYNQLIKILSEINNNILFKLPLELDEVTPRLNGAYSDEDINKNFYKDKGFFLISSQEIDEITNFENNILKANKFFSRTIYIGVDTNEILSLKHVNAFNNGKSYNIVSNKLDPEFLYGPFDSLILLKVTKNDREYLKILRRKFVEYESKNVVGTDNLYGKKILFETFSSLTDNIDLVQIKDNLVVLKELSKDKNIKIDFDNVFEDNATKFYPLTEGLLRKCLILEKFSKNITYEDFNYKLTHLFSISSKKMLPPELLIAINYPKIEQVFILSLSIENFKNIFFIRDGENLRVYSSHFIKEIEKEKLLKNIKKYLVPDNLKDKLLYIYSLTNVVCSFQNIVPFERLNLRLFAISNEQRITNKLLLNFERLYVWTKDFKKKLLNPDLIICDNFFENYFPFINKMIKNINYSLEKIYKNNYSENLQNKISSLLLKDEVNNISLSLEDIKNLLEDNSKNRDPLIKILEHIKYKTKIWKKSFNENNNNFYNKDKDVFTEKIKKEELKHYNLEKSYNIY